jgi:hypothetical protein
MLVDVGGAAAWLAPDMIFETGTLALGVAIAGTEVMGAAIEEVEAIDAMAGRTILLERLPLRVPPDPFTRTGDAG